MGLRGPSPTPTILNVIRGNPGHRPLNNAEPQPGKFKSKPPEHLDATAQQEWKRLVPILKRMRLLTEADAIALANLCMAYSTMIQAQNQFAKAGLLYKTQSGYIQPNPLWSIITRSMELVNKGLSKFGLDPSSRSRIQVPSEQKPAESPWAARDRRMGESA